ncbi:MAG: hypothetical protein ACLVB1_03460 [Blautia obeum]
MVRFFEIVPYRLMKRYGDDALVRENYEAMKRWTAYEIRGHRKQDSAIADFFKKI